MFFDATLSSLWDVLCSSCLGRAGKKRETYYHSSGHLSDNDAWPRSGLENGVVRSVSQESNAVSTIGVAISWSTIPISAFNAWTVGSDQDELGNLVSCRLVLLLNHIQLENSDPLNVLWKSWKAAHVFTGAANLV